jgi:hypothetical protein
MPNTTIIPVKCKDCQFCKLYETNEQYHCRSKMGLYRRVAEYEFCSWGEKKLDERTTDALIRMGEAVHG